MLGAFITGARLAIRSIVRSTLRASLTILGILIGVAAVVTVTALGAGARDQVADQIQGMGSNMIMVAPQSAAASGARGALGSGARLTEDDGRAIVREAVSVAAAAPALRSRAQFVAGERNWSAQVIGSTARLPRLSGGLPGRSPVWTWTHGQSRPKEIAAPLPSGPVTLTVATSSAYATSVPAAADTR